MLPSYVYVLAAAAAVVVAAALAPFRRGRAFLARSVPAVMLFLVLLAVGEVAYRFGRAHGGGGPAAAAPGAVYTCSMHPQVRQSEPGLCPICHMELTLLQETGSDFTIDPVVVQNMGVRLQRVARGPLHRTVRAFGALEEAQSRQHDIALKVGGFVEDLAAHTEGMAIRAGDPLFSLYAPELVVAQEELIAARKSGDADLLEAARQKLLLWDVPAATVDELQARERAQRTLTWTSPAKGVLTQRNVVEGAPAERNQVLLRIVDLSMLWLDARLPERALAGVRVGQTATATFPAIPGLEVSGPIVFVAPQLDPVSRTGVVRLEVQNPEGTLKPGMFARLHLQQVLAEDAVVVPAEAVLDTGRRQLAWVAVGKGKFEPRSVQVGAAGDGGVVQVLEGLQPGDQVVVSGQFLIDAESRLREGTRKFGADGLMPQGDMLPPEPIELSAGTRAMADALLAAYLRVAGAFTEDRFDADGWQAMTAGAAALAAAPEREVQLLAAPLADVLAHGHGPIEQQRVAFKRVSAAMVALLERVRPSGAPGAHVFVHHCPMVEADWLQLDEATRNPYDTSMLACGAVRRAFGLHVTEAGK